MTLYNDCDIRIRNVPIKHARETKFLGLKIDDRHNYNGYVTVLAKQLSRIRGLLFKLSYLIPTVSLRHLYYALFYSCMTYGIAVWGGGNVTNASRIYKINRAAVNIFVEYLPEHISVPFQYVNVYRYHCSIVFHKFVTTDNFEYFNTKISNLIPVHNHSTRFISNYKYTLPA